jgi:hypothetical protein
MFDGIIMIQITKMIFKPYPHSYLHRIQSIKNEGIYFEYYHSNLGCVFGCKYNMYHGSQSLFMMK